jgi:hypothetical protein
MPAILGTLQKCNETFVAPAAFIEEREIMSAAYLHLAWDSHHELDSFTVSFTSGVETALVRQIGSARQPARCPECHSVIYSRRHKVCGVCNQPLPDYLLFTPMQARRVEELLRFERVRHRQWLEQRNLPPPGTSLKF